MGERPKVGDRIEVRIDGEWRPAKVDALYPDAKAFGFAFTDIPHSGGGAADYTSPRWRHPAPAPERQEARTLGDAVDRILPGEYAPAYPFPAEGRRLSATPPGEQSAASAQQAEGHTVARRLPDGSYWATAEYIDALEAEARRVGAREAEARIVAYLRSLTDEYSLADDAADAIEAGAHAGKESDREG